MLHKLAGSVARAFAPLALLVLAACGPSVGDPCTTPSDCGGQVCINQEWTPGGYCSRQCTVADERSCPGGSLCVPDGMGRDFAACFRICRTDADCRTGYVCRVVKDRAQPVCIGPQGL